MCFLPTGFWTQRWTVNVSLLNCFGFLPTAYKVFHHKPQACLDFAGTSCLNPVGNIVASWWNYISRKYKSTGKGRKHKYCDEKKNKTKKKKKCVCACPHHCLINWIYSQSSFTMIVITETHVHFKTIFLIKNLL